MMINQIAINMSQQFIIHNMNTFLRVFDTEKPLICIIKVALFPCS